MNQRWKRNIREVTPYVPGEQPKGGKIIKLNTNENPYPPSPKVLEALKTLEGQRLRLYPDPEASLLTQTVAKYYNLQEEQVFVGNGSDEVLALSFLTYFNSEAPLLFPNISYSFYPVYCELYNIPYHKVPLDADFKIKYEDYQQPNGGIIFPNPNAPTSIALSLDEIEKLLQANLDSVVIVDEAYVDFGAESAVPLIEKYDNLLVIQTFSKSRSLAGLRLGIALGQQELIDYLKAVKNSFNSYPVDYVAQTLAKASMEDQAYFAKHCKKIMRTRTWVTEELRALGFWVADTKTNFLFVSHPKYPAKDIFECLKSRDILVRYFNQPFIDNHLRITVGTDEEMEQLVEVIKESFATITRTDR